MLAPGLQASCASRWGESPGRHPGQATERRRCSTASAKGKRKAARGQGHALSRRAPGPPHTLAWRSSEVIEVPLSPAAVAARRAALSSAEVMSRRPAREGPSTVRGRRSEARLAARPAPQRRGYLTPKAALAGQPACLLRWGGDGVKLHIRGVALPTGAVHRLAGCLLPAADAKQPRELSAFLRQPQTRDETTGGHLGQKEHKPHKPHSPQATFLPGASCPCPFFCFGKGLVPRFAWSGPQRVGNVTLRSRRRDPAPTDTITPSHHRSHTPCHASTSVAVSRQEIAVSTSSAECGTRSTASAYLGGYGAGTGCGRCGRGRCGGGDTLDLGRPATVWCIRGELVQVKFGLEKPRVAVKFPQLVDLHPQTQQE